MNKGSLLMILWIEFGNTRLKWLLLENEKDVNKAKVCACAYDELPKALPKHQYDWASLFVRPQKVLIAINRENTFSDDFFAWLHTHKISFHKVKYLPELCHVAYEDASRFGVDRFLGMLACQSMTDQSFYVLSAGTAITVDFYDATLNKHLGGVIQLGLGSQFEALHQKTGLPRLSEIDVSETVLLGQSTASCLASGAVRLTRLGLLKLIDDVSKQYQKDFKGFYTGGDAALLFPDQHCSERLLFLGMAVYSSFLDL